MRGSRSSCQTEPAVDWCCHRASADTPLHYSSRPIVASWLQLGNFDVGRHGGNINVLMPSPARLTTTETVRRQFSVADGGRNSEVCFRRLLSARDKASLAQRHCRYLSVAQQCHHELPTAWIIGQRAVSEDAAERHGGEIVCSVYFRHLFGGGVESPQKNLQFPPPNGCKTVCSKSFLSGQ